MGQTIYQIVVAVNSCLWKHVYTAIQKVIVAQSCKTFGSSYGAFNSAVESV